MEQNDSLELKEPETEPLKINPKRRIFFYTGLGIVFILLVFLVWVNIVGQQVRSQLVNCPTNITAEIQQSAQAYEYGLNPANWGSLDSYENQICSRLLANSTYDNIAIGSTSTVTTTT